MHNDDTVRTVTQPGHMIGQICYTQYTSTALFPLVYKMTTGSLQNHFIIHTNYETVMWPTIKTIKKLSCRRKAARLSESLKILLSLKIAQGHSKLHIKFWYSEEGPGRDAAPPSPLIAAPNATAHPSTASVPTSCYSIAL